MRFKRLLELGAGVALLLAVVGVVWGYLHRRSLDPLLLSAVRAGDSRSIRALLARGASPNAVNERRESALRIAAARGRLEDVRLLLDCGARVDLQPPGGATALWWVAATQGDMPNRAAAAELLLQRGADPNFRPRMNGGATALMWAARKGEALTVEALLKHGADVGIQVRGATAYNSAKWSAADQEAALKWARERRLPEEPFAARYREHIAVVRLLRAAGARKPASPAR